MTNTKQIVKKMIDFNKESFLSMFYTISYLQNQNENIMTSIIDRNIWLPEESKLPIKEWSNLYKATAENFKNNIEEGYEKIESLILSD